MALSSLAKPPADRLVWFATAVIVALVATEAVALAVVVIPGSDNWSLGMDYRYYRDIGVRWLADGSYYLPRQLAGPYQAFLMSDVFYPPAALLLFAPFAVLPAVLWWVVPITVLGYSLLRLQPAPWAWFVMVVLLAWPRAIGAYLFGNTDIWAVAAVAAGARWGWPAAFLALKPVFLPFALPAVRRRAFWIGLGLVGAISMAMLPLWFDYGRAMRDMTIRSDYSLGSVPLLLIPIVGWLARRRASPVGEAGPTEPEHQAGVEGGNIQVAADHR
jgi:hypothetical protein